MPCFTARDFTVLSRYGVFYKVKVCDSAALSTSLSAIFPTAFSLFMSLCHILIILAVFRLFPYLYICHSNFWCYYCKKVTTHRRLTWCLAFFNNSVFHSGLKSGALWQARGMEWGWEVEWRLKREGNIHVPVADSCWYMAETSTVL